MRTKLFNSTQFQRKINRSNEPFSSFPPHYLQDINEVTIEKILMNSIFLCCVKQDLAPVSAFYSLVNKGHLRYSNTRTQRNQIGFNIYYVRLFSHCSFSLKDDIFEISKYVKGNLFLVSNKIRSSYYILGIQCDSLDKSSEWMKGIAVAFLMRHQELLPTAVTN